jgi:hypothetical protein
MTEKNEKKGLFQRLTAFSKPKKNSCCCSIELEEIPEEKNEKNEIKKEKKSSCCG